MAAGRHNFRNKTLHSTSQVAEHRKAGFMAAVNQLKQGEHLEEMVEIKLKLFFHLPKYLMLWVGTFLMNLLGLNWNDNFSSCYELLIQFLLYFYLFSHLFKILLMVLERTLKMKASLWMSGQLLKARLQFFLSTVLKREESGADTK